ncbi:DUF333 domain-containing protein [Acinetobacter zhairhuonensis]|nr:DUF333 domain-containing protein [Acinetobacter sp. A7.4]MCJ8162905.1 DUF333 domain-containing protein [Acinetobacter sp. A7.4]
MDIKNEKNCQVGYCILPDGSKIEEWALYRVNQLVCLLGQAFTLIGKKTR